MVFYCNKAWRIWRRTERFDRALAYLKRAFYVAIAGFLFTFCVVGSAYIMYSKCDCIQEQGRKTTCSPKYSSGKYDPTISLKESPVNGGLRSSSKSISKLLHDHWSSGDSPVLKINDTCYQMKKSGNIVCKNQLPND